MEVWKCVWICNLHCYQVHEILRRCFLAGIFTSVESPATIALTFEIGVVAALGHKGRGGHPGAMNNSIFCTIPWNFPLDRKGFISLFQKQVMQQAWGRLYFSFSILFSNLNWNEDVLITINSGRKCTGRRSAEGFYSSEHQKSACALPSFTGNARLEFCLISSQDASSWLWIAKLR